MGFVIQWISADHARKHLEKVHMSVIINVTNCGEAEVNDLREHQRAALYKCHQQEVLS